MEAYTWCQDNLEETAEISDDQEREMLFTVVGVDVTA